MKLKYIFTLFILISTKQLYSCNCAYSSIGEITSILFDEVDYVIIGTVIEVFSQNIKQNEWCIKSQKCENVKLKIDSVIKGDINKSFVYTNQFSAGNCGRLFIIGEKYIIFGKHIREFIEDPIPETSHNKNSKYPPPPRQSYVKDGVMNCNSNHANDKDFWNGLIKKGLVVYTNHCMSFEYDSEVGLYYIHEEETGTNK